MPAFTSQTAEAARQKALKSPAWKTRGIKAEHVSRIAARLAKGMPLRYACSIESPPIDYRSFQTAIQTRPKLSALLDHLVAKGIEPILDQVMEKDRSIKYLPAAIWVLERRFPEHFAQQQKQVTINNTTVIGIQDGVLRRARSAVLRARKQLATVPNLATMKQLAADSTASDGA